MRHSAESREGIRKMITADNALLDSSLGQYLLECLADLDDVSSMGHPPAQDPDSLVRKQLHDAQQNVDDLQKLAQRLTVTLGRVADGTMIAHRDLEDGTIQVEAVPQLRIRIADLAPLAATVANAIKVNVSVVDSEGDPAK